MHSTAVLLMLGMLLQGFAWREACRHAVSISRSLPLGKLHDTWFLRPYFYAYEACRDAVSIRRWRPFGKLQDTWFVSRYFFAELQAKMAIQFILAGFRTSYSLACTFFWAHQNMSSRCLSQSFKLIWDTPWHVVCVSITFIENCKHNFELKLMLSDSRTKSSLCLCAHQLLSPCCLSHWGSFRQLQDTWFVRPLLLFITLGHMAQFLCLSFRRF